MLISKLLFNIITSIISMCYAQHELVKPNFRKLVRKPRIVGGYPVDISSFPYMVSVQHFRGVTCGGTLVSTKWVLTAAHCITCEYENYAESPRKFIIIAGSTIWMPKEENESRQLSEVQSIHIHSNFTREPARNDIAMMMLRTEIQLTDNVQLVKLATVTNHIEKIQYKGCVALGWGKEKKEGTFSDNLQAVKLNIIDNEVCQALIFNSFHGYILTDSNLCTFVDGGGHDFCKADSGGPLMCNGVQIGIVSLNFGCGRDDAPGVWTKVAKYENWINATLNDACRIKCCITYFLLLILYYI